MNQGDGSDGVRRWQLEGIHAVQHWISIGLVPVGIVFGFAVILPAGRVPALFVVMWTGLLVVLGSWYLRCVTAVELDDGGTLHLRRPLLRDVSVRADRVRRLGLGPFLRRIGIAVNGASHYVDYESEGRIRRVPLAPGMPGLFELGTALRERLPEVVVELR